MRDFGMRLREMTKDSHAKVDEHSFVQKVKRDKTAGEYYIHFNKICICAFQKCLKKNSLYDKLHKDTGVIDFFISPTLYSLLNRCEKYPEEHAYMFYMGLLYGSRLLKKYLPEHSEFLDYKDHRELIRMYRVYLEEVKGKADFISIVNESYRIIKLVFDEFDKKLVN